MAYFATNITPQLAEGTWDAAVQTQIYLQYAQELEKRRGWSMVARKRIEYTGGTGTKLPVAEDMALAITALPRQADPAAATVADSEITITAEEYGNWITWMHSAEREKSVSVRDYNATRVVNNALDSIDALYGIAAVGGSSVLLANNAANPAALAQGDVITANTFSLARAHMANNRARRIDGNMYGCIMHPSQVLDLFDNADNAKSLTEILKHTASDPFIQGTIGKFMGIAIMELDSCLTVGRLAAGAGAGDEDAENELALVIADDDDTGEADLYRALFFGDDYLYDQIMYPTVFSGAAPLGTPMDRANKMYWKTGLGTKRFREGSALRFLSRSNYAVNK